MLAGIAFLTVITATITSTFVEAARQRAEGAIRDTVAAKLNQIATRLDAIEAGIKHVGGQDSDNPR